MSSYKYTPIPSSTLTTQPQGRTPLEKAELTPSPAPSSNHTQSECSSGSCQYSQTHRCRNIRHYLLPGLALSLLALLLFGGVISLVCMSNGHFSYDPSEWSLDWLTKRALGSGSGSTNGNSPFVHNKLYLIVIFVGLLLVVILAIMLSAWCCRGAFQNPLCCPCYLCACCGGLACLECIGCGLCAEGVDQM